MAGHVEVVYEDLEAIGDLNEGVGMNATIIRDNTTCGINYEDRLYLLLVDASGSTIISFLLLGSKNYQLWIHGISDALLVKNKTCFIIGTCLRESVLIHL